MGDSSAPERSSGSSNFPARLLGRTGWPPTRADQTSELGGSATSRYCLPLLRTCSAISVIVCPSSATTVVRRALSTSACRTAASSNRLASNTNR